MFFVISIHNFDAIDENFPYFGRCEFIGVITMGCSFMLCYSTGNRTVVCKTTREGGYCMANVSISSSKSVIQRQLQNGHVNW